MPGEYSPTPDEALASIANAAEWIIHQIDPLPRREGLLDTPRRVARSLLDLTSGYTMQIDVTTFDADGIDQMIAQTMIPFASLCEHHLLPFVGYVHVGYIPRDSIIGLSKFKRVVDLYARRLQVQERMTRQICDYLESVLKPRGTIVVVDAEHLCMTIRGVQAPGTRTTTSAVTGDFLDPTQGSREEFLALVTRR